MAFIFFYTEPSNADVTAAPPQTPHSADCISKIQAIQRDVLELMLAVEQFGGKRGDRDYIYLDEMLTRNLLKLDTIDTNGKDAIRMARKEAIKCIQTSIAVLEAKADLHLNEKRDSVDQTTDNQVAESGDMTVKTAEKNATPLSDANQQKSSEHMDAEITNANASVINGKKDGSNAENSINSEPSNAHDVAAMEVPTVENIRIDDNSTNDTEKTKNINEKTPEIADAKK